MELAIAAVMLAVRPRPVASARLLQIPSSSAGSRLFVLPFLLLKFLVLGLVAIVVAPIVLLATAAAAIAAVAGVAIPLFPLLCIGFVVWVVMRSQRAATA